MAIDLNAAAGYRARKQNVDLGNGARSDIAIQGVSQPVGEAWDRVDMGGHGC